LAMNYQIISHKYSRPVSFADRYVVVALIVGELLWQPLYCHVGVLLVCSCACIGVQINAWDTTCASLIIHLS